MHFEWPVVYHIFRFERTSVLVNTLANFLSFCTIFRTIDATNARSNWESTLCTVPFINIFFVLPTEALYDHEIIQTDHHKTIMAYDRLIQLRNRNLPSASGLFRVIMTLLLSTKVSINNRPSTSILDIDSYLTTTDGIKWALSRSVGERIDSRFSREVPRQLESS